MGVTPVMELAAMTQDALNWSLAQTTCGAPGEPIAKPAVLHRSVPYQHRDGHGSPDQLAGTAPRAWSTGSSVKLGAIGTDSPIAPSLFKAGLRRVTRANLTRGHKLRPLATDITTTLRPQTG